MFLLYGGPGHLGVILVPQEAESTVSLYDLILEVLKLGTSPACLYMSSVISTKEL